MSLPTSYLTSTKNLESILEALKTAQAPQRFTNRFLFSLDFKSNSDRLVIGVLKGLGFLADDGRPTDTYFRFLDQTQSAAVLAEAIRRSYSDLFQVNINAHEMQKSDVVGKFKTLSQGQYSDSVVDKMASTFVALVKLADFKSKPAQIPTPASDGGEPSVEKESGADERDSPELNTLSMGGLHYNIQIILPESRDPEVYDALFRSLREHLR